MSRRRCQTLFTLAMVGLCLAVIGRAPRLPERIGDETLKMAQREVSAKVMIVSV
ncbi:MAG: hypothetical protein J0H41_03555 [Rhizobiales bacterium]|nr:hypothetical protein [Hyphomicrobiales bacterium]